MPLHFLLVTKHDELQTAPLTPPQLLVAYQIIQAFKGELLSFYNCGDMSGASQKHKHIQFVPIEGEGGLGYFPTEAAASAHHLPESDSNQPFSVPQIPYAHYIRRLDPSATSSEDSAHLMSHLQQVYLSLLDAMIDGLRFLPNLDVPKQLSYNLLFTERHMHVIPRSQGVFTMPHAEGDGQEPHRATTEPAIISCNAIAYTGTILVQSHSDAKRLQQLGGVLAALTECGYPKSDGTLNVEQDWKIRQG